jgi:hypothetical protein
MTSMTDTTLQQLAASAGEWFETKQRDNGDTFVALKDGKPEWLQDLVATAHGDDFLPDDYRYKWARDALEYIAEVDDPDDASGDFADQAVDVYTGARFAWLASNLNRASYCDEAAAEFGAGDTATDIVSMVGWGQYAEASEVYGLVLQALEARLSEITEA